MDAHTNVCTHMYFVGMSSQHYFYYFSPSPYITHIQILPHVCVYIYSATHRLPGADLRLTLNVPGSPWLTSVYDQKPLVICLVKPSVYVMRVCVCVCL